MKTTQNLEKQLAESEKKSADLRKKIEIEKNKNKPKNIMDLVKSFEDACKLKKVQSSSIFNSKNDTPDEIAYKKLKFTIAVLNEGHKFSMKQGEYRYFPYFDINSSGSGLVFGTSDFTDVSADASSAARLCLKSRELSNHAGKHLKPLYEAFIL